MNAKQLFSALAMSLSFAVSHAQVDANGYTTVNATMGASYANRVFVDLSANQLTSQPANTWDIAFWRNNSMQFGTRINDAQNIEVYQASGNPADWDNINVANISSWGNPLYNPDLTDYLYSGALEQTTANTSCTGQFNVGWGCYNIGTHHIDGKVIFVLKYPNNTYVKFMISDYFGGYTFKYAKSNATGWEATQTKTVANGSADQYFNYFSFETNDVVANMEPLKNNWDFMLTRYWTFYNNIMMYRMSGIIQSPRIMVAKASETQETSAVILPATTDFKAGITTIGHSWKPTSGLIPNVVYYIKENDQYYRMYFIENGGSSTGNMYFKYKNITSSLSTNDVNGKISFGLYPNPAPNKQVTLLYDVKQATESKGIVHILDFTGRKVFETEILKSAGFFKKELNLSSLQTGTYLVNLKVGSYSETKKLILK